MCWMHCQRFLQYISGLENSPGGGETIFDFRVRMFTGSNGCRLVGTFRASTQEHPFTNVFQNRCS